MRTPYYASLATTAIALGLAVAPAAQAATTSQFGVMTGGNCQLSIPTTDTKFRPRATGARNESTTTSSFVICPFSISPSGGDASPVIYFYLTMYSLDGAVHNNVSCTAVTGIQTLGIPPRLLREDDQRAGNRDSAADLARLGFRGDGRHSDHCKRESFGDLQSTAANGHRHPGHEFQLRNRYLTAFPHDKMGAVAAPFSFPPDQPSNRIVSG